MKSIFETPFSWRVSNVSQSAMQASFVCTSIHPSYARSLARSLARRTHVPCTSRFLYSGRGDGRDGRTDRRPSTGGSSDGASGRISWPGLKVRRQLDAHTVLNILLGRRGCKEARFRKGDSLRLNYPVMSLQQDHPGRRAVRPIDSLSRRGESSHWLSSHRRSPINAFY